MTVRIVTIYFPLSKSDATFQGAFEVFTQGNKRGSTVYDSVEEVTGTFPLNRKPCIMPQFNNELLKYINNLHNSDGIQDVALIRSMLSDVRSGNELYRENGLPNIKLVPTKKGSLILFDGHHTLIAYMIAGRKYLYQIPHIIVKNAESGFITDSEIHPFFGTHASKLEKRDWRNYVINWQAPENNQLCPRIQKNMGELVSHYKELNGL